MRAFILVAITILTSIANANDCPFSKVNSIFDLSDISKNIQDLFGNSEDKLESAELFNYCVKSVEQKGLSKLTAILERHETESDQEDDQPCDVDSALCPLRDWKAKIEKFDDLHRKEEQLEEVNKYINKTPFKSDLDNYGTEDHWATPKEFFEKKSGDCEDYAIAKYISLRKLGWSKSDLRLVYVKTVALNETPHVILVAKRKTKFYVLDNYYSYLADHQNVTGLNPVYSFNEESTTTYVPCSAKTK